MAQELYLNGIDADSGGPIDGEITIDTELIAKVARGHKLTPEDLKDARLRRAFDAQKAEHFGVAEGIDMSDLSQAGWGIVFPASLPQKSVDSIKDALKPLLALRQSQAAKKDPRFYKEFIGPELGYKSGETKNDFLKRFGRGPGPADPAQGVPYYILIVGSPEAIPFSFQYQLDVQYAVGRIYFDRLEDYAQYAQSVVATETKKLVRPKKVSFFGVANPDDKATMMSSTRLIQPLAKLIKDESTSWKVNLIAPENATKATLSGYIGGKDTPALLFSASHGMSFKPDDVRFLRHTGSILNQDWPGMKAHQPVTDNMYFSADDVASDADVFGMIAFIFACYGGGIPQSDNFTRQAFGKHKNIAPYAFISQLPLKILSHPKGGALGVFAHVERAWGSSIEWDGAVNDVETFHSSINALLNGKPAGAASEYFNQRYAEISTMLTEELNQTSPDNQDDVKIAGMWTSNNDARNYTFIGDPAVRLAVGEKTTTLNERQNLGSIVSQLPESVTSAAADFQPDVAVPVTSMADAALGAVDANFGMLGLFKKDEKAITQDGATPPAEGGINESLKNFIGKLGNYLGKALDNATGLEISTYVSEDLGNIKFTDGKYDGARLCAVTRVNIHGDSVLCFPEEHGEVDHSISNIHLEMVRLAQQNRTELIRTIVEVATSLVDIVK